ncbi:USV1 [Sanghuangporus vaninii]
MVAAPTASHLPPSNPTSRDANVAKRYRPAPAKTFQCRGYGDCHMVFSRSEHLARHIRKHTGERPFTCHCGKQFSRLDNLRQHAQTVHSDKQEENERMMRDLTALHTSMTAAHKAANARGKRAQQQHQQHASASASSAGVVTTSANNNAAAAAAAAAAAQLGMGGMNNGVKVEELQMHRSLSSANNYGQQRPGTSVGYDVGPDSTGPAPSFGHRAWQIDTTGANNPPPGAHLAGSRLYHAQEQLQLQPGQHQHQQRMPGVSAYPAHHPADGHSFRDSHQSFRSSAAATTASTTTTAAAAATTVQSPQSAGAQYQYGQQFQQQSQQYAPGQSFLAPQSFLPSPAELASRRPSSSRSRPPSSGGPDAGSTVSATAAPRTTLPPLHSVVPQSIAAPGRQPSVLQLPPGSAGTGASRRPGTAPAAYAYLPHRSSFGSSGRSAAAAAAASITGSGLGTVPELSVYGGSSELGGPGVASSAHEFARFGQREYAHVGYPPSPPDGYGSGANDSPFSFHPPSLGDSGAPTATAAGTSRLRKRPYGGSESDDDDDDDDRRSDRSFGAGGGISDDDDGEYDVAPPGSSAGTAARPPPTPSTAAGERHAEQFDYSGSGSRPQSRRLSVMELCNDPDAPGSTFLPISASRPATASGRFEFTSPGAAAALAESDAAAATIPIKTIPAPSSSSAITATAVSSAAAAAAAVGARGSSNSPGGSPSGSSPFAYGLDSGPGGSGGGLYPAVRRHGAGAGPSSSTAAATSTASVLPRSSQQQQQFQRTTSPRSPVSYGRGSPASTAGSRSSRTGSPAYAYVGDSGSVQYQQQQQSASSPSAASVRDQVRVSVSPRGSTATPTGVRV